MDRCSDRCSAKCRKLIIDNQPIEFFESDKFARYYEERALLLASPEDIVVLRRTLPSEYMDYLYSTGLKNVIYLDSERDECLADAAIREHEQINRIIKYMALDSPVHLKAYIPDEKMQSLADTLHIPLIGRQFYEENHKKSFVFKTCKELGFNIIDTMIINSASDLIAASSVDFFNSHGRVIIKPDKGIGGQMISEYSGRTSFDNRVFPAVVQEFMPAQSEGSIQFFEQNSQRGIYICKTFQENFTFRGFHYPMNSECEKELRDSAESMLSYFRRMYKDALPSFGIDFIICNSKVYFHDINPRSTGVTYIFSLLQRAYGEQFINHCEFIYIQTTNKFHVPYQQLRTIIDTSGVSHISASNSEGYALLYPGMLQENVLNLLILSESKKAFQYFHRIMDIVGRN